MKALLTTLVLLFLLILFLSFPAVAIGMWRPKLLKFIFRKNPTRKLIMISFLVVAIVSLIGMGSIIEGDQKDFPAQSITVNPTPTLNTITNNVQPKQTTHVSTQVKKPSQVDPTSGWYTYIDSVSDYSIKYPSSYYVNNIQRSGGNKPSMVDFNVSSNNLSTEDDKTAFNIMPTDKSSFADFDHSPQSCKDDEGNCSYKKIVNSHNMPLGCYTVGNATDQVWVTLSNTYLCQFTNINTSLIIFINTNVIDSKTKDNIINSFQLVSSPESATAIAQEVNTYGQKTSKLNNQAVAQMTTITKDLAAIQEAKSSQLQSLIPQVKSDLNTAQTTFQQIYDELNTIYVPYDMQASYAHYKKAIYVWIQATKAIIKGVNDNSMNEIESTQDIIQKADAEVNKATDQVNNYKINS